THGHDNERNFEPIVAMQIDGGWRLHDVMIGLHVGVNSGTPRVEVGRMTMSDKVYQFSYVPRQVGISLHIGVVDRFYAMPWIGKQDGAGNQTAIGLSIGADMSEDDGHRFTATATVSYALGSTDEDAYTSVWFGVGYRFWDR